MFAVAGLNLIFAGKLLSWQWIRNFWLRIAHLLAITFVVVQSWMGQHCPLTILEMHLRRGANQSVYEESFIQYWFSRLLYYDAPEWVFVLAYTLFGFVVLISWFWIKPNTYSKQK